MELMPNYLLMGMAGCNDGQKKKKNHSAHNTEQ